MVQSQALSVNLLNAPGTPQPGRPSQEPCGRLLGLPCKAPCRRPAFTLEHRTDLPVSATQVHALNCSCFQEYSSFKAQLTSPLSTAKRLLSLLRLPGQLLCSILFPCPSSAPSNTQSTLPPPKSMTNSQVCPLEGVKPDRPIS